MKPITVLLILCLTIFQSVEVKRKSNREMDGFAGLVKKVSEEWTPASNTWKDHTPGTRCRNLTRIYDVDGRVIQSSYYPGFCGNDEIRVQYTYDKDGNYTTSSEEIRGENGLPPPMPPMPALGTAVRQGSAAPLKPVLKFDAQGRKIEETGYQSKVIYGWDEKGRLRQTQSINTDGKVISRHVYDYEGDNRYLSEETSYARDGKASSKTIYTEYEFNSQGDWTKRKETVAYPDRQPAKISIRFRRIEYHNS